MNEAFWHQKWEQNEIGFHESAPNRLLVGHFEDLALSEGGRVFLPLCGKTRDISWLLLSGYQVAGVELSQTAVEQLFFELGVEPQISETGKIKRFAAANIDIYVGDIFRLSGDMLGPVAAIYDRAALVALPEETRSRYTSHLMTIADLAPQFLITFTYNQSLMDGPPFSVSDEEVHQHYKGSYDLTLLKSEPVPGGLKGKCEAQEKVWLLQNRSLGR